MIYVLNAENIDQIFRSNQPIYSFYLVYHLGVFSREPLPSAKQSGTSKAVITPSTRSFRRLQTWLREMQQRSRGTI